MFHAGPVVAPVSSQMMELQCQFLLVRACLSSFFNTKFKSFDVALGGSVEIEQALPFRIIHFGAQTLRDVVLGALLGVCVQCQLEKFSFAS